ncbi:MAG: hypothetical protein U1E62_11820 [Alsobacter sp.]
MRLRVIDLDGSTVGQAPVAARLAAGQADLTDCRDVGAELRLWAWTGALRRFAGSLPRWQAGELVLLGSGDFHHLTAALLERVETPLTLVHVDNHPDWAWTFPERHCGSWINAALGLPDVRRVITIGCCSDDLAHPDRAGVNLAALRSGRLAMHPWHRPATRLRGPADPVPGHVVAEGELVWTNLCDTSLEEAAAGVLAGIPTRDVWISIDKDVLAPAEAATNWDQGAMPLDWLTGLVEAVAASHRILGVDLCGDFSPAAHRHPMKWFEARMDQPHGAPPDLSVNARTNGRLLDLLETLL